MVPKFLSAVPDAAPYCHEDEREAYGTEHSLGGEPEALLHQPEAVDPDHLRGNTDDEEVGGLRRREGHSLVLERRDDGDLWTEDQLLPAQNDNPAALTVVLSTSLIRK